MGYLPILSRLIGKEIELTQEGYRTRPPADGYVNKRIFISGKKKTIQAPDPKRAKYYIKMFEMRACGRYKDKEIVAKINAMGFKTKTRKKWDRAHENIIGQLGGKPLTTKQLQVAIKNPIYCGIVCEKWTHYQPVKASYKGLVSIKIFNQANRGKIFIKEDKNNSIQILYDNYQPERIIKTRTRDNPLYPYKNVILCPYCKRPFKASASKGKSGQRFPAYHCERGHRRVGIKKKDFDDNVERFIKNLRFTKKYLESLESVLLDVHRTRQKEIVHEVVEVNRNITALNIQKEQAINKLIATDSEVVKKELEKKIEELDKQINTAQQERDASEISERDIRAFINYARFLMEHPYKLLTIDNPKQKQALFGLVFEEFPTYFDILNGTPKLTLIFELSQQFEKDKSLMVPPTGIEPISSP